MLKKETKKEKIITKGTKKNYNKYCGVFQRFFRRRKFENRNYASVEIERCQTEIDKEEQNLRIITKRISLLNDLIIGVKELENVYFAR